MVTKLKSFYVVIVIAMIVILLSCSVESDKPEAFSDNEMVIFDSKLMLELNSTDISYPQNAQFEWIQVNDFNGDKYLHEAANLGLKHYYGKNQSNLGKLVVTRIYRIDNFLLLSGGFYPPFPGGSISWIVNESNGEYVGHFFDENSR